MKQSLLYLMSMFNGKQIVQLSQGISFIEESPDRGMGISVVEDCCQRAGFINHLHPIENR